MISEVLIYLYELFFNYTQSAALVTNGFILLKHNEINQYTAIKIYRNLNIKTSEIHQNSLNASRMNNSDLTLFELTLTNHHTGFLILK